MKCEFEGCNKEQAELELVSGKTIRLKFCAEHGEPVRWADGTRLRLQNCPCITDEDTIARHLDDDRLDRVEKALACHLDLYRDPYNQLVDLSRILRAFAYKRGDEIIDLKKKLATALSRIADLEEEIDRLELGERL